MTERRGRVATSTGTDLHRNAVHSLLFKLSSAIAALIGRWM
jgi:hypothetical protein